MVKRSIIIIFTIGYCFSFLMGYLGGLYSRPSSYNLAIDQNTTVNNTAFNFEAIRILNGRYYVESGHNVYTTIGKKFERNLKAFHNVTQNATSGFIGYVSLSNDASPSASWTQLTGEATTAGASRKAFDTLIVINATSINGTVTFTFSGSITLQCAGIQWDSHSTYNNNLYAAFAFTSTAFISGDKLIIRYYNQETGT